MAVIVLVAWVVCGRALTHYLDIAALMTSVAVVFGGALVAATIAFFSFRAVQRRRVMAGGCVACEHKCQHAMTDRPAPTRLWLISTADRGADLARPAPVPVQAAVPVQARPVVMLPTPRWPDRPLRGETPRGETLRGEAARGEAAREHPAKVRVPAGTR